MDGGLAVISADADANFTDSKSKRPDYYSQLFTFKPSINETSRRLSENMAADFMTRQKLFIEKQKKHLEEAATYYRGLASPGKHRYRAPTTTNENEKPEVQPSSGGATAPVAGTGAGAGTGNGNTAVAALTFRTPAKSKKTKALRRSKTVNEVIEHENENETEDSAVSAPIQSRLLPKRSNAKASVIKSTGSMSIDRISLAKSQVDEAIKHGKIFSIIGPYPQIRRAMRKRGWIERFSDSPTNNYSQHSPKRKVGNDDDDENDYNDDDGLDEIDTEEEKVPPWEEDGGIYGVMSRMLRDVSPMFIWSLCKDQVDFRNLRKEQIVNHHSKTGCFTTKLGLCSSLRELPWYDNMDSDEFYPRAYIMSRDEERRAFIDDYRMTACVGIVKLVIKQFDEMEAAAEKLAAEEGPDAQRSSNNDSNISVSVNEKSENGALNTLSTVPPSAPPAKPTDAADQRTVLQQNANGAAKQSPRKHAKDEKQAPKLKQAELESQVAPIAIPGRAVELAIAQCQRYLRAKSNDDVDDADDIEAISDADWDLLLQWSYDLSHKKAVVQCSSSLAQQCRALAADLRDQLYQYEMDGTKNVWICKPGAKSRGRDIKCFDSLKEIVAYTTSPVSSLCSNKEAYVVQKYIENPLLIYNVKFDIRQWFIVTDWNPLTVYWYYDCYLRFCSQTFSLNDYDESIHLSNNSIQCKYTNAEGRSSKLPEENMWYSWQFDDYLRSRGHGRIWQTELLPQMKAAVLKTLLCVQNLMENRKNCFEMFGADFMISEDFRVHLIEINSAPCLAPSTAVTDDLVEQVVDDLLKLILDRRTDKNCDIGKWEMIHRSPLIMPPPYLGLQLVVEGHEVRKPPDPNVPVLPTARVVPIGADIGARVAPPAGGDLTRRSMSVNNLSTGVATVRNVATNSTNATSYKNTNVRKNGAVTLGLVTAAIAEIRPPIKPAFAGNTNAAGSLKEIRKESRHYVTNVDQRHPLMKLPDMQIDGFAMKDRRFEVGYRLPSQRITQTSAEASVTRGYQAISSAPQPRRLRELLKSARVEAVFRRQQESANSTKLSRSAKIKDNENCDAKNEANDGEEGGTNSETELASNVNAADENKSKQPPYEENSNGNALNSTAQKQKPVETLGEKTELVKPVLPFTSADFRRSSTIL